MLYRKVFSFYVALLQVKGSKASCTCVILNEFGHVACIEHNAYVGAFICAVIVEQLGVNIEVHQVICFIRLARTRESLCSVSNLCNACRRGATKDISV